MKGRKGIVGVAVLWILAALTVMAMTALYAGRLQFSRGRTQMEETRALALLQSGFALERDSDFSQASIEQSFETGKITVERISPVSAEVVRVRGVASVGHIQKAAETGWSRSNGQWRAVYWKEQ